MRGYNGRRKVKSDCRWEVKCRRKKGQVELRKGRSGVVAMSTELRLDDKGIRFSRVSNE